MKRPKPKPAVSEDDDMLPEYDFTGQRGVRGRYYRAYREGYTVTIHQPDGSTVVERVAPEEGTIVLAADVRPYFPDSETANKALRCLIPLMPKKRVTKKAR